MRRKACLLNPPDSIIFLYVSNHESVTARSPASVGVIRPRLTCSSNLISGSDWEIVAIEIGRASCREEGAPVDGSLSLVGRTLAL